MNFEETISKAVAILREEVPSGSRIILFGSCARVEAKADSDLDFLVIEPEVTDRLAEMGRLAGCLGRALIPADVMVMDRNTFERWQETPNTLAATAAREGKEYEPVA